jgi:hypothetical protein
MNTQCDLYALKLETKKRYFIMFKPCRLSTNADPVQGN